MSDRLRRIFDSDEHDLLKISPQTQASTPDDRLADAFLEINDFYTEYGRIPEVSTTDVYERKLGVRLRALILDDDKTKILEGLDIHGLLKPVPAPETLDEIFAGDRFGLLNDQTGILTMRNVPANIKKAENIARARKSRDFAKYEQGFKDVHSGLISGELLRSSISSEYQILPGRYFVFNGRLAYVESRDNNFKVNGKVNARLRVIYENGTESNILLRSFARTLYRAKEGARIVPANYQTDLEWSDETNNDQVTGYIYILRSLSEEPQVQNLQNLYKIGYTTDSVENRIKNAQNDPTYLNAPVETVARYKCLNMNTQKLEHLIHHFFAEVRLNISLKLPDGTNYTPNEWYIVPLDVLDRVIELISNGEIVNYYYDSGLHDIVLDKD